MADNEKYYYLRLKDNFFESDELLLLESMPDGILFSNILLKLYLRSLKNNGKLMLNDRIPYSPQMLANVVRQPTAVVEKAINVFVKMGIIDVLSNGAIYMLDIQNFIGKTSTEADRKRLYREKIANEKLLIKQKMDKCPTNVGENSDKKAPEIEIEIEKEIEIEIEKKKEKKQPVDFKLIIKEFSANDAELENSLLEWLSFRKSTCKGKEKFTERALRLNLDKLRKLSNGFTPTMKEIVNESVMNGWKGFFPLRKNELKKNTNSKKEAINAVNELYEELGMK